VGAALVSPAIQTLTCTSLEKAESSNVVLAYPLDPDMTLVDVSVPDPFTIWKFTVTPLSGLPFESTRAVRGTFTVAPCAMWAVCGTRASSIEDESAARVVCTCLAGKYEAGASCAVMVIAE